MLSRLVGEESTKLWTQSFHFVSKPTHKSSFNLAVVYYVSLSHSAIVQS